MDAERWLMGMRCTEDVDADTKYTEYTYTLSRHGYRLYYHTYTICSLLMDAKIRKEIIYGMHTY